MHLFPRTIRSIIFATGMTKVSFVMVWLFHGFSLKVETTSSTSVIKRDSRVEREVVPKSLMDFNMRRRTSTAIVSVELIIPENVR